MGAWGAGAFENDDAMDWIAELKGAKNWSLVEQAFALVLVDDIDYREAPDCSVAVGAAAVLAAAVGRPPAGLPGEAAAWIARVSRPHGGLPAVGAEALDAILAESELKELWEESDSFSEWQTALLDLRSKLVADAPPPMRSV